MPIRRTLRAFGFITGARSQDYNFAGVEKEITLPLITTLRSGNMLVLGQVQIDMTDFGITPPTAMMGMLKTDPKVKIKFETLLAKPTT